MKLSKEELKKIIEEERDDWDFIISTMLINEIEDAVKGKSPDDSLEIAQELVCKEINRFNLEHGSELTNQVIRELLMRFVAMVYYNLEED